MTIGTWQPDAKKTPLTLEILTPALGFIDADSFPDQAPSALLPLQPFIKTPRLEWQTILSQLTSIQLKQLCQFFTLAEDKWTDWFGGDKNPVIWICKELKTRGEFPDTELTAWIKNHTENRFLPYGNPLG